MDDSDRLRLFCEKLVPGFSRMIASQSTGISPNGNGQNSHLSVNGHVNNAPTHISSNSGQHDNKTIISNHATTEATTALRHLVDVDREQEYENDGKPAARSSTIHDNIRRPENDEFLSSRHETNGSSLLSRRQEQPVHVLLTQERQSQASPINNLPTINMLRTIVEANRPVSIGVSQPYANSTADDIAAIYENVCLNTPRREMGATSEHAPGNPSQRLFPEEPPFINQSIQTQQLLRSLYAFPHQEHSDRPFAMTSTNPQPGTSDKIANLRPQVVDSTSSHKGLSPTTATNPNLQRRDQYTLQEREQNLLVDRYLQSAVDSLTREQQQVLLTALLAKEQSYQSSTLTPPSPFNAGSLHHRPAVNTIERGNVAGHHLSPLYNINSARSESTEASSRRVETLDSAGRTASANNAVPQDICFCLAPNAATRSKEVENQVSPRLNNTGFDEDHLLHTANIQYGRTPDSHGLGNPEQVSEAKPSSWVDETDFQRQIQQYLVPQRSRRKYNHEPFPHKLHRILTILRAEEKEHIASFMEEGGFWVHDRKAFAKEVLPRFFRARSWNSFRRQLATYRFTALHPSELKDGAFSNPFFKVDRLDLCDLIIREDRQTKK